MEIEISATSKNYANADRARALIDKISREESGKVRYIRHFIFPRELPSGEVRYHPVAIGADNIALIHRGIMVIG
mgnify:CR=1 FL=1